MKTVTKYLVVTYDRDPDVMPIAVFRTDSIDKANRFLLEFEKKQLPVATEIVLDQSEEHGDGKYSAA